MSKQNLGTVSGKMAELVRTLEGALGASLIGVVTYESPLCSEGNKEEDVGILVVLADTGLGEAREISLGVWGAHPDSRDSGVFNVESYLRMLEHIRVGDPSAWFVCCNGIVLSDRFGLLAEMQSTCRSKLQDVPPESLVAYLRQKSALHQRLADQTLRQFLLHLQILSLASAQAACIDTAGRVPLSMGDMVDLGFWEKTKNQLIKSGATRPEIEAVEQLLMASTQYRKNDANLPLQELMRKIHNADELWRRLASKATPPQQKG
jgi:hypothetical protein